MIAPDGSLGALLALGSATCFAGANFCVSRTTGSKGDKGTMFSVLMTMVISFALWLVTGREGLTGSDPAQGVAWFVLAGFLAMVLGRSFLFASVRTLGVARSAAVKRLNPFFSVLLGVLLLGEAFGAFGGAGILAIALSFFILITENRGHQSGPTQLVPADYLPGVIAALCYALAYIARKYGLEVMPSPTLGTFISAFAGFSAFGVSALFSARYRTMFLNMFANLDRWVFSASILMSVGQILFFAALAVETLIAVAMISSTEIFIAILLASFVFRTEPVPPLRIVVAASCAMAGAILIAID